MTPIQQTPKDIQSYLQKVKLPWTFDSNVPFYVDVKKPRPSLSKHDGKKETLWDYYDGVYMAMCVNEMPAILEYIKELESELAKCQDSGESIWKDRWRD